LKGKQLTGKRRPQVLYDMRKSIAWSRLFIISLNTCSA